MSAKTEQLRDKWFEALSEAICGVLVELPDVSPCAFRNSFPLDVIYSGNFGTKEVHKEDVLSPQEAHDIPTVAFSGFLGTFYTLVMIDPDAPSRYNPEYRFLVVYF